MPSTRPIGASWPTPPSSASRSRRPACGAISGHEPAELEPRLRALVRREIFEVEADPALAGARPVRLRPVADPRGRLRHAGQARAARPATWPRRATSRPSATTSWPAPWRRTTSPPTRPRPRAPRRTRSRSRPGSRCPARPTGPSPSAATSRPWPTCARRRRSPTRPPSGPGSFAGPPGRPTPGVSTTRLATWPRRPGRSPSRLATHRARLLPGPCWARSSSTRARSANRGRSSRRPPRLCPRRAWTRPGPRSTATSRGS